MAYGQFLDLFRFFFNLFSSEKESKPSGVFWGSMQQIPGAPTPPDLCTPQKPGYAHTSAQFPGPLRWLLNKGPWKA